jgi:hypothetical protein
MKTKKVEAFLTSKNYSFVHSYYLQVFPVCGNTYKMLHETRFAAHFDFIGDFSVHYGIFDGCGKHVPFESASASTKSSGDAGGACC